MRRLILISLLSTAFLGCQTLEERLAQRVGCNPKRLQLKDKVEAPGYNRYNFVCEGRPYVCKDFPFHSTCGEDKGEKVGKEPKKK